MDTYHFNNSVKTNFKEKGKTLDANIKNELIDTINTLVECSELLEFETLLSLAFVQWERKAPDFAEYFNR